MIKLFLISWAILCSVGAWCAFWSAVDFELSWGNTGWFALIVVNLLLMERFDAASKKHPWPFKLRLPRIRIEWPEPEPETKQPQSFGIPN